MVIRIWPPRVNGRDTRIGQEADPRVIRGRRTRSQTQLVSAAAAGSAFAVNQPAIFSRVGTPPECTTLPSTTTPGVARIP